MFKQDEEKVVLSVLNQSDKIWLVQSRIGVHQQIARSGEHANSGASATNVAAPGRRGSHLATLIR